MNILIIGNGFDLAHGLPTKYEHFLDYTKTYMDYINKYKLKKIKKELKAIDGIKGDFLHHFHLLSSNKQELFNELGELIINNVWLSYFYRTQINEGWIDFESEISRIVQVFDSGMKTVLKDIASGRKRGSMTYGQLNLLSPFIGINVDSFSFILRQKLNLRGPLFTPRDLQKYKEILLNDLKRLIRCLEIYLDYFVGKIKIDKVLLDIEGLPILDKVLTFNYTDTYKRLYKINPWVEIDYIHGKTDIKNTIDSNNMVLGIDEYLRGDERNENIEFIEFKKFYQRIHKETGSLYRSWLKNMKEDSNNKDIKEIKSIIKDGCKPDYIREHIAFHRVFFFGHSLDITDKDVLQSFILSDNVQTTIFYKDKEDYGKKIANLVRIIGQAQLIERTGGKSKSIEFKEITKGE